MSSMIDQIGHIIHPLLEQLDQLVEGDPIIDLASNQFV